MNLDSSARHVEQEAQAPQREAILFDDLLLRLNLDPKYVKEERLAPVIIGTDKRPYKFLRKEWKVQDFDAVTYLQHINAPFIEVAGPTPERYILADIDALKKLGKNILVSNLFSELREEVNGK